MEQEFISKKDSNTSVVEAVIESKETINSNEVKSELSPPISNLEMKLSNAQLSGLLCVNKPIDWTSADVVGFYQMRLGILSFFLFFFCFKANFSYFVHLELSY